MGEHAVNAIDVFADIFKQQDAAIRFQFPGSAERGGEQCQIAASERTGRAAGADGTERMGGLERVGIGRIGLEPEGRGFEKCFGEVLLRPRGEMAERNRAMEGDEPGAAADGGMERGDIAVAQEDFRIAADEIEIDKRQHLRAAIATAQAEDGADLGVGKQGVEVFSAFAGGTGKVAVTCADVGGELEFQAEEFAEPASENEFVGVRDVAGGGDEADGIAWVEGAGEEGFGGDNCG